MQIFLTEKHNSDILLIGLDANYLVEGGDIVLSNELHFLLMKCFYNNNRMIVKKIQGMDLLPGQPKILECLAEGDGITPKEIGRCCALDKSTVTGLLGKMEHQKLVFRRTLPSDKRSVKIYLTNQGKQMVRQVKEVFKEVDAFATQNLTFDELEQLIHLLNKILTTFERKEDIT